MAELFDNDTIASIIDNEGWPDAIEHIRSDEIADPVVKRIWTQATYLKIDLDELFEELTQTIEML